ncbi:hypothetical protein H0H93_001726 [Arthromyces matolae]|nr:hypothetical protein H0H93_001726 [Arthromyces matolae]
MAEPDLPRGEQLPTDVTPPVAPRTPSPSLNPPRPFFLAGARPRRSASDNIAPPPPSSFVYPFQSYSGNPDPLPMFYGHGRRRMSLESLGHHGYTSDSDSNPDPLDLHKPQPPFATSSSSSSLYRASAAAPIAANATSPQPPPAQVFRPPFLSPASRPTSALSWAPPALDYNGSSTALNLSPSGSNLALAHIQHRPPLPSTMIEKGGSLKPGRSLDSLDPNQPKDERDPDENDIPPATKDSKRHRLSWWLTFSCLVLGVAAAAALCYTGVNDVKKKMLNENQLCLVMDENFSEGTLNDAYWTRDVLVDDRGFQISTNADKNLYILNNQLYIFPTLTRDDVPDYAQDGQTYEVQGCTGDVAAAAPAPDTTQQQNSTSGNGNTSASATAMRDFNDALDTWYATWPQSADDRAFRISSVKMWSKEPCS